LAEGMLFCYASAGRRKSPVSDESGVGGEHLVFSYRNTGSFTWSWPVVGGQPRPHNISRGVQGRFGVGIVPFVRG